MKRNSTVVYNENLPKELHATNKITPSVSTTTESVVSILDTGELTAIADKVLYFSDVVAIGMPKVLNAPGDGKTVPLVADSTSSTATIQKYAH